MTMARKIAVTILMAVLALTSCSVWENDDPVVSDGTTLSLELDPGRLGVTRATAYGEDEFNENVISDFKLFFYLNGASDDDAAIYVWPESGYATATNSAAVVSGASGDEPSKGKVTLQMKLGQSVVEALFPDGATSCRIYVAANIDGAGEYPSGKPSVNEIKNIVISSPFGPDASVTDDPYASVQDNFVMDGESDLSLGTATRTIEGTVHLYRAASKITFTVTKVTRDGVDENEDWQPDTENMHVAYVNGISKGLVNGEMARTDREEGLFSYKTPSNKSRQMTGDATAGWTHELPFYSYYNQWRDSDAATTSGAGSKSSSDLGDAPYLLLSLPWKSESAGRYFTCYYAVPFNNVTGHLDRNTWYDVRLAVSILGSGDPDNPTVVNPSYMILPWGRTSVKTEAELMRYRYLMVDQSEYVMDNVNSLTVPFYTSHPVEVVDAKMTKTILKPSSGYQPYEQTVSSDSSDSYTLEPDSDAQTVTFTHDLVNDYDHVNEDGEPDYDVTAYTLTFTIRHTDNTDFQETITVTQYPALYVVASLNSDCNTSHIDSGTSGSGGGRNSSWSNHSHYGYLFVNGSRNTSSNVNWNGVSNLRYAGNTDPYMYVVTISSLPSGSSYIIGDPRKEEVDNLNYSFANSNWLYGNSHSLTYYYPTDTDESRVNNMIAPSFRIASSYGVTSTMSYTDAQKRCASYQEDGYPAGRWRVPTRAEIMYMVMLAKDWQIPVLLSDSGWYWGSDKKAYCPGDFDNPRTSNSNVRCVYDEWYWTDKLSDDKKNTFYWGDKERVKTE
jgi:hypothetical protein